MQPLTSVAYTTTSCGSGNFTHTRSVIVTSAHGGLACPLLNETVECNTHNCPTDCVVGDWFGWGNCTVECDSGEQARVRSVESAQGHGGIECPDLTEWRVCNTHDCECPPPEGYDADGVRIGDRTNTNALLVRRLGETSSTNPRGVNPEADCQVDTLQVCK
jgi:hypothetical protein